MFAANTIVSNTAETVATASSAHWYLGSLHGVTVTRRRLSSGLVRISIRFGGPGNTFLGEAPNLTASEARDLPAAEADALFAAQVTKWNDLYTAGTGYSLARRALRLAA